jgi:hypothetical protein
MTPNQRIKTKIPPKAILLIGEGVEKKDRLSFENWGFRESPIGAPP